MGILDKIAAGNTKRLEVTASMSDASTNTYIGEAVTDSDNGAVTIMLADDAITPEWGEGGVSVTVPTTTAVRAGDAVMVSTFGGNVLTSPVVTGVVGRGDELQEIAEGAEAVANAVSQHFWDDTNGAHVTESTREDWEASQTGANSLWNSAGMLFRDGLTNLLAVLASGVAIYDGLGNAASNIVASFTSAGATIGKESAGHAVFDSSGMHVKDGADTVFDATYTETTSGTETLAEATIASPGANSYVGFTHVHDSSDNSDTYSAGLSAYLGMAQLLLTKAATFSSFYLGARSPDLTKRARINASATDTSSTIQATADSIQANGIEIGKSMSASNTRNTSNCTSMGTNSCRRYGNVVVVAFNGLTLSASLASGSTSGTLATVPSGYRPLAAIRVPFGSSGNNVGYANVGTGGAVTVRNSGSSAIATSTQLSFEFVYII